MLADLRAHGPTPSGSRRNGGSASPSAARPRRRARAQGCAAAGAPHVLGKAGGTVPPRGLLGRAATGAAPRREPRAFSRPQPRGHHAAPGDLRGGHARRRDALQGRTAAALAHPTILAPAPLSQRATCPARSRAVPPLGRPGSEGADAMRAWVMAWVSGQADRVEPASRNDCHAGQDHIMVARGRDHADVAPVKGVLRPAGAAKGEGRRWT